MAIINSTGISFHFNTQASFDTKVEANELVSGGLYFVEGVVYAALTSSTYQRYGNVRVASVLPEIEDAETGMLYYSPATGIVSAEVAGAWKQLNNAIVSIREDEGTGLAYLVKFDGTETLFELTGNSVTIGDGTANEIVTADAGGYLKRGGFTVVGSVDDTSANTKADKQLVAEEGIISYVMTKIGAVVGGIRFKGGISAATAAAVASAPKKHGDMFRVADEIADFLGTALTPGDWLVFNTDTDTPAAGEFDVFEGVENAAIAALTSTSNVLPLAASQGPILVAKIEDGLDEKLDKVVEGDPNLFVMTIGNGQIKATGISKASAMSASPSANTILDEVAVHTELSSLKDELETAITEAVDAAAMTWNV